MLESTSYVYCLLSVYLRVAGGVAVHLDLHLVLILQTTVVVTQDLEHFLTENSPQAHK